MRAITVTLDENLIWFVRQQAKDQRTSPEKVVEEMIRVSFETRLKRLYSHYIQGEYSLGRLAKELGMTTWEVVHLLEERGWATHNLPVAPSRQAL
jgi:predicted HTH domain antitoxin